MKPTDCAGLETESTKLDAIKTVAVETHMDAVQQVQQLSTDVLLGEYYLFLTILFIDCFT